MTNSKKSSQKKTVKEKQLKKEVSPVVSEQALVNSDWYKGIVEEIGAIATETIYQAQSTILKGKYDIGQLINDHAKQAPITALVQYLARDLKISERELWYCVKFVQEYKKLEKSDDFNSKAISWNRVKKMLADPEKTGKPCEHEEVETIKICKGCGKRVDN